MSDFDRAREIRLNSPAKINLSLRVLGSRPDGFHEIETRVQQVSLFDNIRIRPASGAIRVSADRGDVPSGKKNLAYQAAVALREAAGIARLGASIYLKKNIPSGAGLGGGSGNAAAVLWALNRLWALKFSPSTLSRIAA
ncbi:MAG: 4-(cytidine 5'-diphospho)-2-C-methyl-D-erythritol kinase, partial [Nitrospinaceae bacterium]|nr:4-(cytidine 5'-diphospho)-2-C-methyl-D-erythritol kinase [Nitrospinaceae bacterium]